MKLVLLALSLILSSNLAHADEPQTLAEHMRAMGYLLDEVYARSGESVGFKEAADSTRNLRGHLIQSIALSPRKIEALKEGGGAKSCND